MILLDKLQWRYATKAMSGKKVPQDKIDSILKAAQLAPTSSGLQPFEIIVVTNQKIKEKIRAIGYDQPQITDCSHLLVFAAWDTYTEERINTFFDLTNEIRGGSNEGWESYRQHLLNTYPKREPETNFTHASKQAYIAFGLAIAAAAFEGVDCTPMEGFDAEALDNVLDLKKKGLRSAVILPVGYRDEEKDWLAKLPKVRKSMKDLVTNIK